MHENALYSYIWVKGMLFCEKAREFHNELHSSVETVI